MSVWSKEFVFKQKQDSARGGNIGWKSVAVFVVATYAISWSIAAASYLSGVRLGQPIWLATTTLFMIIPALVAITLTRLRRDPVRATLAIRWRFSRWWLVALLGPLALIAAVWAVGAALPGVHFVPSMEMMTRHLLEAMPVERRAAAHESLARLAQRPPLQYLLLMLIQALFLGPTLNAILAFGEEAGWRGFLFNELAPLGFWRSSFLIGVIWGGWHAPIIAQGYNYPGHAILGIPMMIAMCTLLAPLLALLRARSGSVLACAVAHGTINAAAGLATLFLFGGSVLLLGLTGLAGILTLAAANIVLALSSKAGGAKNP
jgi:uncharacterized protein